LSALKKKKFPFSVTDQLMDQYQWLEFGRQEQPITRTPF